MRIETNCWLGRKFLSISGEGPAMADPEAEADGLFGRFKDVLAAHGLGLENTIRSRIWAADGDARTACSKARTRTLAGPARSATSSYIAPDHLGAGARVAMDLIALHPTPGEDPGETKIITEQDPPQGVIRWLTVGRLLVLAGMSCNQGGPFEDQARDILGRITACLGDAGCGWSDVRELTLVHENAIPHDQIFAALARETDAKPERITLLPAEGYSRPGKLLEIETMAILPG